jgi:hypothetical protein
MKTNRYITKCTIHDVLIESLDMDTCTTSTTVYTEYINFDVARHKLYKLRALYKTPDGHAYAI